jgi:hypothetical protein
MRGHFKIIRTHSDPGVGGEPGKEVDKRTETNKEDYQRHDDCGVPIDYY